MYPVICTISVFLETFAFDKEQNFFSHNFESTPKPII